jgi:hypothetical protein
MEAKRRAIDEIATRQNTADEKRQKKKPEKTECYGLRISDCSIAP